ncbi:MAG: amidase [Pseudomonadota bacterium]
MLNREDYRSRDATGLADLVHRGEAHPKEILHCALSEIERLNPVLNAVVALNPEKALADCGRVDAGDMNGMPFAGVPFLAKDINVDLAGFQTTHACRFFADVPPATEDSVLVQKWKAAGLVLAGRTNTPEFATEFVCEPDLFGPTLNPWDISRTPGGSSGGAAAAVASGMVPMAHASDSGGSIRVPAACCGLFGFKPTSGVIASGSWLGPLVGGLNVDHVISRSVRDSATMLSATAGPEPFAWTSHSVPDLTPPARTLTIGVVSLAPDGAAPDPEVVQHLAETRRLLEDIGHHTVDWSWPEGIDAWDCAQDIWASEMAIVIEKRARELGREPTEQDLGPAVYWAFNDIRSRSAIDMARTRAHITDMQVHMARALDGPLNRVDMLMLPVTSEPPLKTGLLSELAAQDVSAWAPRSVQFAPYTEIFNITGQPAMSVPLYQDSSGLPLGLQFAGRVGEDGTLLALAQTLEEACPWAGRRPDLHRVTY